MKRVAIIDYNTSNLFSITNAIYKMNLSPVTTSNRNKILNCDALILPGVGSFQFAMGNIRNFFLDHTLVEFVKTGKPFLGICLGFQLLFESSDEVEFTKGLGLIKGKVIKIKGDNRKVPHLGWNKVFINSKRPNLIKDESYFYFVHSYYASPKFKDLIFSKTTYQGLDFCSSVKKDNLFGCQFHPEKSGKNGLSFLHNYFKSELNV